MEPKVIKYKFTTTTLEDAKTVGLSTEKVDRYAPVSSLIEKARSCDLPPFVRFTHPTENVECILTYTPDDLGIIDILINNDIKLFKSSLCDKIYDLIDTYLDKLITITKNTGHNHHLLTHVIVSHFAQNLMNDDVLERLVDSIIDGFKDDESVFISSDNSPLNVTMFNIEGFVNFANKSTDETVKFNKALNDDIMTIIADWDHIIKSDKLLTDVRGVYNNNLFLIENSINSVMLKLNKTKPSEEKTEY